MSWPKPSPSSPLYFLGFEKAVRAVRVCLRANVPVSLIGRPGIGKSSLLHRVAELEGYRLFDYRLSDKEPGDVGGLPTLQNGRLAYAPPLGIPFEVEGVTDAEPALLLWEEFDRADIGVQNVTLQYLFDRTCNGHTLPSNCRQAIAMNATSDVGTTPLSKAAANRVCHLYLDPMASDGVSSYREYALGQGVTAATRDFALFKTSIWAGGTAVDTKNPLEPLAFPTPRSFDMADKVLRAALEAHTTALFDTDDILLALLAGCVGKESAIEFLDFHKHHRELPAIEEILEAPDVATVPELPGVLTMLRQMLLAYVQSQGNPKDSLEVQKRAHLDVAIPIARYARRWPATARSTLMHDMVRSVGGFGATAEYKQFQSRLKDPTEIARHEETTPKNVNIEAIRNMSTEVLQLSLGRGVIPKELQPEVRRIIQERESRIEEGVRELSLALKAD